MAAPSSSSSSAVLSPPPLPVGDGHDAPNWVLLDILGYMGDYHTATGLAESNTSTDERIQVSFCTARPPQVSQLCVRCPDLGPAAFVVPPKVISADSDLILFQVSVCPQVRFNLRYCDYFLYRAHLPKSSLDLLPHPYPDNNFKDQEVALLSLGNDGQYAVAALTRRYQDMTPTTEFDLYLYRSSEPQQGWTSKVLSVAEPLRDKLCPVDFAPYHDTTKVIILGHGKVGWVDLWRGILVCNVLDVYPVLHDIPLPLPARGNRKFYYKCSALVIRDITVNLLEASIKYIEIANPREKVVSPDHSSDSSVRQKQRRAPSRAWKATTWSRPIQIDSREDWHRDCTFDVADIIIDSMHSEQLPSLRSTGDSPSEATLPAHLIGFPTMSMDDDVFFLLYMASRVGYKDVVVSIDMKKNTVQGFANLATGRDFTFPRICTSEISKYLSKDEGTKEASETNIWSYMQEFDQ
ncbi:unnamed protein product [Alopecurus aequalis]